MARLVTGRPGIGYSVRFGDLFDLFQRAACVLVTVREGERAGFSGPVSGVATARVLPSSGTTASGRGYGVLPGFDPIRGR
jgi:hypothetical protein